MGVRVMLRFAMFAVALGACSAGETDSDEDKVAVGETHEALTTVTQSCSASWGGGTGLWVGRYGAYAGSHASYGAAMTQSQCAGWCYGTCARIGVPIFSNTQGSAGSPGISICRCR